MLTARNDRDFAEIKRQAAGQWCGILRNVCGLSDDQLNPRMHQPCPMCGGTDRFRAFNDVADTGGLFCNQCHDKQNGDGFASIMWLRKCAFPDAVELVADALGKKPLNPRQNTTARKAAKPRRIHSTLEQALEAIAWRMEKNCQLPFKRHHDAIWLYHNADGSEAGAVARWNLEGGRKTFRQVRRVDGGWTCGGIPPRRPLYNLPVVLHADVVWVCEGEKSADAINSLNMVATSPSQGAKSPELTDWRPLDGKHVVVCPDNDDDGEKFATAVQDLIQNQAPNATIEIKRLIDDWPELPPKGDAHDWCEHHNSDDSETLRAKLAKLPSEKCAVIHPAVSGPQDTRATSDRTYNRTDCNDIGNAAHFARQHRDRLRYVHAWKKFLVWDGCRWKLDDDGAPIRLAKQTVVEMFADGIAEQDPNIIKLANETAQASKLRAMISLATPELPVSVDELDSNGWLLNCPNGTVDLRTGELRPHERWQNITKLCPTEYQPHAAAATWQQFLTDVFVDADLVAFVQRLFGYCLTADVSEQKLTIFYGTGANGKSTLLNAFLHVVGTDYTMQAMPDFLMEKRGESHPTEKAALFGKRFVSCVETESSRKLAESTVKILTGGERISARRMREDFWEFDPEHKLVLCTNHKPIVAGTDHGIWRRMLLVPFSQRFEGDRIDKSLPEKLKAESAGILAWLVRGCIDWQRHGLNPPACVADATDEYRSQEDVIGRFVAERCEPSRSGAVRFSALYTEFESWCEDSGDFCPSKRKVGSWLSDQGFEACSSNGRMYRGIELKANR